MGAAYDRGLIVYRQARYPLAVQEFQKELRDFPNSRAAHAMLGMSLLGLKQRDAAEHEIREAVRLGPTYPYAYYAMAHLALQPVTAAQQGRSRIPRWVRPVAPAWPPYLTRLTNARRHVLEAIKLDSNDASFFILLAWVEAQQSQWKRCLIAAERGLSLRPGDPECSKLLARAQIGLGRTRAAGVTLDLAIENAPDHPLTHAERGWYLLRLGMHREAAEHFAESLRLDPVQKTSHIGLRETRLSRLAIYRWPLRVFMQINGAHPVSAAGFAVTVIAFDLFVVYALLTHFDLGNPARAVAAVQTDRLSWAVLSIIFLLTLVEWALSRRRR